MGSAQGDEGLRAADGGENAGLKAEELHRANREMLGGVIIECTCIQQMKENKAIIIVQ